MKCDILKPFRLAIGVDGMTSRSVSAGERGVEIRDDLVPGLLAEGYVKHVEEGLFAERSAENVVRSGNAAAAHQRQPQRKKVGNA